MGALSLLAGQGPTQARKRSIRARAALVVTAGLVLVASVVSGTTPSAAQGAPGAPVPAVAPSAPVEPGSLIDAEPAADDPSSGAVAPPVDAPPSVDASSLAPWATPDPATVAGGGDGAEVGSPADPGGLVPIVDPPVVAEPGPGPGSAPGTDAAGPLDAAPRKYALGQPTTSRPVSAPASDPMSQMERDAGLSVKLSDGRQLWMFADSALVVGDRWDYFSGRGTGAISVPGDPYTLTEPWVQVGDQRHPASQLIIGGTITCPTGYSFFAWPASAVAIPQPGGGDAVLIYYQSICGRDGEAGTYFNVAMGIARYDYNPAAPPSPSNPIRAVVVNQSLFAPMPGHSGPGASYGTTSMLANGYVYAYGCQYSPVWQSCRVARVNPSQAALASAYRFWNGADWVAGVGNAVDLDMPNSLIGVKGSVAYIASVGLYAFADNDFPGPSVAVRWARSPEGPWSTPSFVNLPGCAGPECWAAEVHGNLSTGGNLAITYFDSETRPGMRAISVPIRHEPVGGVDMVASGVPNQMLIWGWAVDPDVVDPIGVHLYLDDVFVGAVTADQPRADLARTYPGQIGGGFVGAVDVRPGHHMLCAYALNAGQGTSNPQVGCREFDVVAPTFAPVAARNGDGRLEVFASDAWGAVVHAWQLTPGGPWSTWAPMGLTSTSPPVVARNGDGRLEIFAVDFRGGLIHKWQAPGGGWSDWMWMGITVAGAPGVGTNPDGRLELFVAETGGRLLRAWQITPWAWSGFLDTGATASASPALRSSLDGRQEVFVTGGDGTVVHAWQMYLNGPFSGWENTGIAARGAPSLERSDNGRLEVFVTTPQNQVVHRWQIVPNGGWSGWAGMGLTATGPPTAGKNADGRLEVFAPDFRGGLVHAWQIVPNSAWSGWYWMGIDIARSPAVAVNLDARMAMFAVLPDGRLVQASQSFLGGWSAWRAIAPGQT